VSQPPVEVFPSAKKLTADDAVGAILDMAATRFARTVFEPDALRARWMARAAVAIDKAVTRLTVEKSRRSSTADESGEHSIVSWSKRVPV
jgi:hypothetical protein